MKKKYQNTTCKVVVRNEIEVGEHCIEQSPQLSWVLGIPTFGESTWKLLRNPPNFFLWGFFFRFRFRVGQ